MRRSLFRQAASDQPLASQLVNLNSARLRSTCLVIDAESTESGERSADAGASAKSDAQAMGDSSGAPARARFGGIAFEIFLGGPCWPP